jgi:hypothetical protein
MEDSQNSSLVSHNIKITQIENIKEFTEIYNKLICCICLDIPFTSLQCYKCESVICDDCNEIFKIAGKKCVTPKCPGDIRKSNKFIREVVSMLKLTCMYCNKKGIEFSFYNKHLNESCDGYKLSINKKEMFLYDIKEKAQLINDLTAQVNEVKLSTTMGILNKTPKKSEINYSKDAVRNALLTFNLPLPNKMELYNAAVKGNLPQFKDLIINKKYPIFEEISAKNFYWTSLHYAMHYGNTTISFYIFDLLRESGKFEMALNLYSADGRCPLLCLLRSNNFSDNNEKKREVFQKVLERYGDIMKISPDVKKELKIRNMYDMLKKFKKD